jgi:hypothetical protein
MEDNKRHKELDDLFSNLPLPDEDGAWQDMKKRLDEDDDDRFIVLPPFLQGCVGWTLLLALMLGGTLWFFFRDGEGEKALNNKAGQVHQTRNANSPRASEGRVNNQTPVTQTVGVKPVPNATDTASVSKKEISHNGGWATGQPASLVRERRVADHNLEEKAYSVFKVGKKKLPVNRKDAPADVAQVIEGPENNKEPQGMRDTVRNEVSQLPLPTDSVTRQPDTASHKSAVADSVKNTPPKKEDPKKKYRLGLGIALQQQVPFDGQEWTPYNYRGRKGSLADYIPSVYLRLYSERKWFVQSEFKYGAPQYTKEFVYSKEIKTDTFGIRSSTSYRLKKTYYHQLPLSFNVYIKPSWSVGTGVVYNRFYGAVSDREVRMGTAASPDTLVSKELVLDKNESLFRSTNLQWLLETQYRWKRWSVGGRFTEGLQPYIEYVDEQGRAQNERNHSLQMFIRYELWNSKGQ